MTILYITYIPFGEATSGSSVRPQRMYKALLESGHEIKLLSGEQGRGDKKHREAAVAQIRQWLKTNRPDLCYIESPTYPIMFHCDRKLIRDLHKMGIPTGYFYRDFYRRYPDLFPRRKGLANWLKETYLDVLQWLTDRVLQNVDIIYLPSEECCPALPEFKTKKALPPAGEDRLEHKETVGHTGIYVGGVSEAYGADVLLDAYGLLNGQTDAYKLLLVCRPKEWEAFSHPMKNAPWLEVFHTSGEGLTPLYRRADIGILPKKPDAYNKMAISVKIFEYMSFGLPIAAVSSTASDRMIRDNGLGVIAEYSASSLAQSIRQLLEDQSVYASYRQQVKDALLEKHLWKHRVEVVLQDLIKDESAV